jgi:hypothetical protein
MMRSVYVIFAIVGFLIGFVGTTLTAVPTVEYEGCWRPPSRDTPLPARNIGIAERGCGRRRSSTGCASDKARRP